jgi:hypothetical protein
MGLLLPKSVGVSLCASPEDDSVVFNFIANADVAGSPAKVKQSTYRPGQVLTAPGCLVSQN